eukprot:CAMPEP_0115037104 /NCGR_PEP_ID=MMETSP0216-20121206/42564_1 /TAXON_ID=223996 /ORGANISM="Protocruzia adherens, Strain Boccale" /LENGTH=107 /DNA_ID=CAMNT_0002417149 /DNA_START=45 /DNA_END=365 /DNA_ORIENTATION=-
MEQKEVPIESLTPQQLVAVKKQLDSEMQQLTTSFQQLRQAQVRYKDSKTILDNLNSQNQDKEILIPLTNSLYVPGTLENVNSVTVEVGTGYFVEHKIPAAQSFCERK